MNMEAGAPSSKQGVQDRLQHPSNSVLETDTVCGAPMHGEPDCAVHPVLDFGSNPSVNSTPYAIQRLGDASLRDVTVTPPERDSPPLLDRVDPAEVRQIQLQLFDCEHDLEMQSLHESPSPWDCISGYWRSIEPWDFEAESAPYIKVIRSPTRSHDLAELSIAWVDGTLSLLQSHMPELFVDGKAMYTQLT
ncbi:hypothetical protein EJ08DRAFT_698277 [Tothia fuscella]|uniref:Uncharacterized protein n=1 Tax=Tothia fuscella TaxID=1048955 RepID=A0A9P4TXS8_9PEZI|nr:hypothetical protein EJ08DRAFT_698277 [Tothia fuscella]